MALTLTPDMYVTQAELVSEGLLPSVATAEQEVRTEMLALQASRYIDKMTRRWFWDREYSAGSELLVDGSGFAHLHLPAPLISVQLVETRASYDGSWSTLASTSYVAYLHDGRGANADNPKIVAAALIDPTVSVVTRARPKWPQGMQNIRIRCHLGYLDQDGETPLPIRRAAMRLMAMEQETIDDDGAAERRAIRMGMFTTKSTHNRSITIAGLAQTGRFTGDSLIDSTLMQYRLPI